MLWSTNRPLTVSNDGQQERAKNYGEKLESLDPSMIERGGDGKAGRHNSRGVHVNTSQGNNIVIVLETRINDGQCMERQTILRKSEKGYVIVTKNAYAYRSKIS